LHVNGHVGLQGNELADRMSMLAIASREVDFARYREAIDIAAILARRSG
jgi:ribonuclease HI